MKRVALIAAAALALSGCAASKLSAADTVSLINAFHNAGCGGSVVVDVRGGAGQLGGSASGQFTANGECPVGDVPAATERLN